MINARFGLLGIGLLSLAACSSSAPPVTDPARQAAAPTVDWQMAHAMTVKMTDFAFEPEHLTLRAGMPVRLVLVNDSGSEHNFSAPEFFASAAFGQITATVSQGEVMVPAHKTAELELVPSKPGQYPLECTELMHSIFGMSGSIEVVR